MRMPSTSDPKKTLAGVTRRSPPRWLAARPSAAAGSARAGTGSRSDPNETVILESRNHTSLATAVVGSSPERSRWLSARRDSASRGGSRASACLGTAPASCCAISRSPPARRHQCSYRSPTFDPPCAVESGTGCGVRLRQGSTPSKQHQLWSARADSQALARNASIRAICAHHAVCFIAIVLSAACAPCPLASADTPAMSSSQDSSRAAPSERDDGRPSPSASMPTSTPALCKEHA